MTDINISILSRILSPYLQEHPEDGAVIREVLTAADSDSQANEEDNVLSEADARRHVERQQELGRRLQSHLSVLTSHRDELVGSLEAAQATLGRLNAAPAIGNILREAAAQDNNPQNLSLPELQAAIQELERLSQQTQRLNATEFMGEVERLVTQARELERVNPEVFLPETEAAQRQAIDLNFLKYLEPGDWQAIEALQRAARGGRGLGGTRATDAQTRFYVSVLTLLTLAHVDWHNRDANWSLSFEQVQAALAAQPAEPDGDPVTPELEMATLRYAADQAQQDLGRIQGERLTAHPERSDLGVSFLSLRNADPSVFVRFPGLELYRNETGGDGILTMPELARSLRHYYPPSSGTPPNPETVMNELRVLITAQGPASAAPESVAARRGDSYSREVSRLVLEDLVRMREGFSERDRQLVTEMPMDRLIDGVSWLVTLGGWTTGGNTYEDVQRGFAELADARRGRALESLRRLIEHPDRALDFQRWLGTRSGAAAQVNIPNALAYLATAEPEAAALLNGSFFQAGRLWNIRQISDPNAQARAWLSLASDLRSGYRGDGVTSIIHAVPNLAFARAILHGVVRETTDRAIRLEARRAFQDSMGYAITDEIGRVNHWYDQGNGELGLWPLDWFRNYPDEAVASAPADGALIVASFVGGGAAFRLGKGLMNAAGRRAFLTGLSEFVGVRSASMVIAAEGSAATSAAQGWFGRWLSGSIARRVATAQARVDAAVTAAERASARVALARAQNVQQILTSPVQALADSGRVGGAMVATGRVLSYPLRALGWLAGEGIPRYAIASLLYDRYLRARRPAPMLDREYRLELPLGTVSGGTARRN